MTLSVDKLGGCNVVGSSQGSSTTRANEPRLIAFNEYVNEEGTEAAVVQVHPDADSMAFHMEVIAERAATAYAETVEATTCIQVFGTPLFVLRNDKEIPWPVASRFPVRDPEFFGGAFGNRGCVGQAGT